MTQNTPNTTPPVSPVPWDGPDFEDYFKNALDGLNARPEKEQAARGLALFIGGQVAYITTTGVVVYGHKGLNLEQPILARVVDGTLQISPNAAHRAAAVERLLAFTQLVVSDPKAEAEWREILRLAQHAGSHVKWLPEVAGFLTRLAAYPVAPIVFVDDLTDAQVKSGRSVRNERPPAG